MLTQIPYNLKKILLYTTMIASFTACEKKDTPPPEIIPEVQYLDTAQRTFQTQKQWQGQPIEWENVIKSLQTELYKTDTLETKLHKPQRDIWKKGLDAIEKYKIYNHDAKLLSSLQFIPLQECPAPSITFTVHQRALLQQLLQQHRNVLWQLARLELAQHLWITTLQQMESVFKDNRIKDAELRVYAPIHQILEQSTQQPSAYNVLTGKWRPGSLHLRIARLKNNLDTVLYAQYALQNWKNNTQNCKRWNYLASVADPPLEAAQEWIQEYQKLFEAFKTYTEQTLLVEQAFPANSQTYPCLAQNMRRLRILASLYNKILPMQWELSWAKLHAQTVHDAVQKNDYADTQVEYIQSELKQFIQSIELQKNTLTRSEDLLLIVWDQSNREFWNSFPDFLNPIENPSQPACENTEAWKTLYYEMIKAVDLSPSKIAPEPLPSPTKRGKPVAPLISDVMELLNSPARIDEVEKGLLAIYELEAHMSAIRDEFLRLCKRGACKGFPEAQLPKSPRKSSWVTLWHQTPSTERPLGLSIIVLKLCQLHLSRLVQRLSEIYAWFAETSNADIHWPKLKSWQRVWTLYAEQNGTYLTFLRSVAELDQAIYELAKGNSKKPRSPHLQQLLDFQYQLFGITIDYARFIDIHQKAPIPYDELLNTWTNLYEHFSLLNAATIPPQDTP